MKKVFFKIFVTGVFLSTQLGMAFEPRLTGRWGTRYTPPQLVSTFEDWPTKAMVVVGLSTKCPLARRLIPHLNELHLKYREKGVQFIGLFPNATDDLWSMSQYALEMNIHFPIMKDQEHKLTSTRKPWFVNLGMEMTPEVVMLDTREGYDASKIFYRGMVNGFQPGGGTENKTKDYLENAISAFLNNKELKVKEIAAHGCFIEGVDRREFKLLSDVTFYKDILPIVQEKCQSCHVEGEPGAEAYSAFYDYDDVASRTVVRRIRDKIMPPWHGEIGDDPSVQGSKFLNEARLTKEEIEKFLAWEKHGFKEGNPKDAPKERVFPAEGEWKIGQPDTVFQMEEAYKVPKEKLDEYQYYRIKANFPEDRYIQAMESRPGNRAVVHHITVLAGKASDKKLSGSAAMLELYGLTGNNVVNKLGDYVPGDDFNSRVYPKKTGHILPKNTDIILEMHYTPTGRDEAPDRSEVGIIWTKEKPERILETHLFVRKDIKIPPHDSHYKMTNYYQFSTDVKVYAVSPHMHYRGKDYKLYKVVNPGEANEKRTLVLSVPTYDFAWQRTYEFSKPIELKAGEALFGVGHLDNSRFNPHNPDPTQMVPYGIKSEQEMFNLRINFERVVLED